MPRKLRLILAMTGALIAVEPAIAQSTDQDVRCLLASNVFASQEKDPAKKQMEIGAALFYLGRLGARVNPVQLKAQIVTQTKTLNAQTVGPVMTACVREIGAKQLIMQTAGKELQAASGAKK